MLSTITLLSITRHLFRYIDEQAFRYNNRKDMNDADRFSLAVSQSWERAHLRGGDWQGGRNGVLILCDENAAELGANSMAAEKISPENWMQWSC